MTALRTVRWRTLASTLAVTAMLGFATAAPLSAQVTNCISDWVSTGTGGGGTFAGVFQFYESEVNALAVFDDGSGPALYAGGRFASAGSEIGAHIARWDGSRWSAIPGGGLDGPFNAAVHDIQVYDDGSGPALFVAGPIWTAGDVPTQGIAKWDGAQWSTPGFHIGGLVHDLAVFDRGSGPELVLGGFFAEVKVGVLPTFSGPRYSANNIVSWNGSRLQRFGAGMNQRVTALEVYDDGNGEALYAGGRFTIAGAASVQHIARWDGAWSSFGGGVNGFPTCFEVFDPGTGAELYVGGGFTFAGSTSASKVASWNGSHWSSVGGGLNHSPSVLKAFDDGSGVGRALFTGGDFGFGPALGRWSGGTWELLGSNFFDIRALQPYDDGTGPKLIAGGIADLAENVREWDGSSFSVLAGNGLNGGITAIGVHDDGGGNGEEIYVSGTFTSSSVAGSDYLAKWDGVNFSSVAGGIDGPARAYIEYDDGSGAGPALYVGGDFSNAGGMPASRIARFNGTSWSALGSGLDGRVTAMEIYDDGQGGGPALYVGGYFTTAGGLAARGIARWDGLQWSTVGTGVGFAGGSIPTVRALEVFDDGTGSSLFVGGLFPSIDGIATENAAIWNGTAWSAAGNWSPGPGRIRDFVVFDSGTGPKLYAAALFLSTPSGYLGVATWNGSQWTRVTLTSANVGQYWPGRMHGEKFAIVEERDGPALYLAGASIAGPYHNHLVRYDGATWSALPGDFIGSFFSLAAFDLGEGPALLVGGNMLSTPTNDSHLAVWQTCERLEEFCAGDGGSSGCTPCACGNDAPVGSRGGCLNSVLTSARLIGSGSTDVALGTLRFEVEQATPVSVALLVSAGVALPVMGPCPSGSGITSPAFDGLRCVGQGILRHGVRATDAQGSIGATTPGFGPPDAPLQGLASIFGFVAGQTRFFQAIYRDNPVAQCGTGLNTTNGVRVLFR